MARKPTGGKPGRPTLTELRRREAALAAREAALTLTLAPPPAPPAAPETAPPPAPAPAAAPAPPAATPAAPPPPPPAAPSAAVAAPAASVTRDPATGAYTVPIEAVPRVVDDTPVVAYCAPGPGELPPLPAALPYSPEALAALQARLAALTPPPPPAPPRVRAPEEKRLDRKIDKALLQLPHGLESVAIAKAGGNTWRDSIFATAPCDDAILEEEVDLLGPTLDRWFGDHREKLKWFLILRLHARHCGNALVEAEKLLRKRRQLEAAAAAPAPAPIAPPDPTAAVKATLAAPPPPAEVAPAPTRIDPREEEGPPL
jgi:hypothetical protein